MTLSTCIGALDGKPVQIECPNIDTTAYFIYKTTHSIVLLTLVNVNYNLYGLQMSINMVEIVVEVCLKDRYWPNGLQAT